MTERMVRRRFFKAGVHDCFRDAKDGNDAGLGEEEVVLNDLILNRCGVYNLDETIGNEVDSGIGLGLGLGR